MSVNCSLTSVNGVKSWLGNDRGTITVISALAGAVLFGAMGLAVDYGIWSQQKSKLQYAADAAAINGAEAYQDQNVTPSEVRTKVGAALRTDPVAQQATAAIATDTLQKSVTVTLKMPGHRMLSALILSGDPMISVRSSAHFDSGAAAAPTKPTCVLSLNQHMMHAIEASGGSKVVADKCMVQVNSASSKAVDFSGGSTLTSAGSCFVGGVDQGLALMTPAPALGCAAMADPFLAYSAPAIGPCTHSNFSISGGSPVLSPGVYCGGLTLSSVATATLLPGLYVIKDGLFKMSGGGTFIGNGVTILLTGNSVGLDWSGGGSYHLVASSSGPLAGFAIFMDPNATPAAKSVISGTGAMYYEGILYFAGQQVEVSGTGLTYAAVAPWTILIANNFVYSGGSQMVVKADATLTSVFIPPELLTPSSGGGQVVLDQ